MKYSKDTWKLPEWDVASFSKNKAKVRGFPPATRAGSVVLAVPTAPAPLPICEPTSCWLILGVPVDARPAEWRDHRAIWVETGMTH